MPSPGTPSHARDGDGAELGDVWHVRVLLGNVDLSPPPKGFRERTPLFHLLEHPDHSCQGLVWEGQELCSAPSVKASSFSQHVPDVPPELRWQRRAPRTRHAEGPPPNLLAVIPRHNEAPAPLQLIAEHLCVGLYVCAARYLLEVFVIVASGGLGSLAFNHDLPPVSQGG
eukprot:8366532-Pyramimonas_sp.AAC.1